MTLSEITPKLLASQALSDSLIRGAPRCERASGGDVQACLRRQKKGHWLDVDPNALCYACAAYWHAECAALLLARLAAEAPDDEDSPAPARVPARTPPPAPPPPPPSAPAPTRARLDPVALTLDVPPGAWCRCGVPDNDYADDGRLLAQVTILGKPHHLEAIPVVVDDEGLQQGADPLSRERIDEMGNVYECAFKTVRITLDGTTRDYALFLFPHGD